MNSSEINRIKKTLNEQEQEMVELASKRISDARDFNWEGGFEQKFFEEWLAEGLYHSHQDMIRTIIDEIEAKGGASVELEDGTSTTLISKDTVINSLKEVLSR